MVGNLLKQIFPALGRFLRHHATRPFRSVGNPESPSTPPPAVARDDIGLDPRYVQPVEWPRHRTNLPPPSLASDQLYQLWTTIPGGMKWTHYFKAYRAIFESRRDQPLRILEIGVFRGASLQLWRQYFPHPNTTLVGIDIDPSCGQFDSPNQGVHVRIGSQIDTTFLDRVLKEFGPFDLIIDDGSHRSSHIIATFNHLFAAALEDGGIYFVEDIHTNYWPGWRDSKLSFFDVCNDLVEHMQAHYRAAPPEAFIMYEPSDQPDQPIGVPLITTMIDEVRLFDSMAAIYKTRREHVPYLVATPE